MNKEELRKKIEKTQKELLKMQEELNIKYIDFESVIIITENVKLKDYNEIKENFKNMFGEDSKTNELGLKKMAYEIKGNKSGFYISFEWNGNSDDVANFEKYCRENDNIIKYITIKQDWK